MSERIATVTSLVSYLKRKLDKDPILQGILVEGEISNLRKPYTGHWYFSLKDEKAQMNCVMFSSDNRQISFPVNNGDKVIVKGDVSIYVTSGTVQMVCRNMKPSGIGELYLKLEELKKKLNAEGLFDTSHKKKLPRYPMSIALVTGNNTAAREDVLITLKKRWPIAEIIEYPAPVQGSDAPPKIIDALRKADLGGHDVILLVRGGGSIEDLWCFNDESLARCVYDLNTPVVTGVGHEIDTTLVDYCSDVRANTPTGAVELSVPDQKDVKALLKQYESRMCMRLTNALKQERAELTHIRTNRLFMNPQLILQDQILALNDLNERMVRAIDITTEKRNELHALSTRFYDVTFRNIRGMREYIREKEIRLTLSVKEEVQSENERLNRLSDSLHLKVNESLKQKRNDIARNALLLDAYSPLKVLSRGYSIASCDDKIIRSTDDVNTEDKIRIRVSDGTINAMVHGKEKMHE